MKNHRDWQGDSRKMQSYAMDVFEHRDKKDTVEDRTRELLHDTALGTMATRDTASQFAKAMANSVQNNPQNRVLSNALNGLADQVTEAQVQERTRRS